MSFQFVDQILTLEPNKRVVGIKHITAKDIYLVKKSLNEKPAILPGIVSEAVGQCFAWLVLSNNNFTYQPVGGVVEQIDFKNDAYLGDDIILEANIVSIENEAITFNGIARVADKEILSITNSVAPLIPVCNLRDPQRAKNYFTKISSAKNLYQCEETIDKIDDKKFFDFKYDEILSCEQDDKIIAHKHIRETEPFFEDHFSLRPVVPLTALSQYNVSLAQWYIDKFFPKKREQFAAKLMRNIKIYDFIDPGADIETIMKISNDDESNYVFRFCSKVKGRRVFVAQLIFQREM
ncbi:MAG: hypothetical protein PVI75_05195 [Gammaproteobacteria bacterium]|jgi:3-hydroxymyristoyl/3-hydroxydecanoyl-(acyl carrier protein) dehydratase